MKAGFNVIWFPISPHSELQAWEQHMEKGIAIYLGLIFDRDSVIILFENHMKWNYFRYGAFRFIRFGRSLQSIDDVDRYCR